MTRVSMPVPTGHQVEKNAKSPSAMLRRINRPRVHRPDRSSSEIGQLAISPVVEPCAFRAFARRKTAPSRGSQALRDFLGRAGDRRLAAPGPKMTVGADAEHIALAGMPQGHLDIANAVNAVGCDPAKRNICGERLADHFYGECRLCREGYSVRNMGRRHPDGIVRPGLGQIQSPVDEGMAVARHISAEHADLTVRDLARRPRVLTSNATGGLALLEEP